MHLFTLNVNPVCPGHPHCHRQPYHRYRCKVYGPSLIYAEAKLGELLKAIPKDKSKFNSQRGSLKKTTSSLPKGRSKRTSHKAQTIADNPEMAEAITDMDKFITFSYPIICPECSPSSDSTAERTPTTKLKKLDKTIFLW